MVNPGQGDLGGAPRERLPMVNPEVGDLGEINPGEGDLGGRLPMVNPEDAPGEMNTGEEDLGSARGDRLPIVNPGEEDMGESRPPIVNLGDDLGCTRGERDLGLLLQLPGVGGAGGDKVVEGGVGRYSPPGGRGGSSTADDEGQDGGEEGEGEEARP